MTVIEDEDGWKKVRTSDGFIGYVQTNSLKHIKEGDDFSSFEEPQYTGISKDYKINMAWHNVENTTANGYIQDMLASTKGLTTIAPTLVSYCRYAGESEFNRGRRLCELCASVQFGSVGCSQGFSWGNQFGG